MDITKTCTRCEQVGSLLLFHKNKRSSTGRSSVCKVCKSELDSIAYNKDKERIKARSKEYQAQHKAECAERMAAWNKANPERAYKSARKRHLRRKYGLTPEEFTTLLAIQGNSCSICQGQFLSTKATRVDHDHSSGEVRGILCHNCNALLGHAKDSTLVLESAISYLSSFKKEDAS